MIHFDKFQISDSGVYRVVAANSSGTAKTEAHLEVLGKTYSFNPWHMIMRYIIHWGKIVIRGKWSYIGQTKYPWNAEGKLSELTDNWQTPIGKHFVRNHCAVPLVDPNDYLLTICGEGN